MENLEEDWPQYRMFVCSVCEENELFNNESEVKDHIVQFHKGRTDVESLKYCLLCEQFNKNKPLGLKRKKPIKANGTDMHRHIREVHRGGKRKQQTPSGSPRNHAEDRKKNKNEPLQYGHGRENSKEMPHQKGSRSLLDASKPHEDSDEKDENSTRNPRTVSTRRKRKPSFATGSQDAQHMKENDENLAVQRCKTPRTSHPPKSKGSAKTKAIGTNSTNKQRVKPERLTNAHQVNRSKRTTNVHKCAKNIGDSLEKDQMNVVVFNNENIKENYLSTVNIQDIDQSNLDTSGSDRSYVDLSESGSRNEYNEESDQSNEYTQESDQSNVYALGIDLGHVDLPERVSISEYNQESDQSNEYNEESDQSNADTLGIDLRHVDLPERGSRSEYNQESDQSNEYNQKSDQSNVDTLGIDLRHVDLPERGSSSEYNQESDQSNEYNQESDPSNVDTLGIDQDTEYNPGNNDIWDNINPRAIVESVNTVGDYNITAIDNDVQEFETNVGHGPI